MAFHPIDLGKPFDLAQAVQASQGIHIKGMFLQDYVAELKLLGIPWPGRIVPFGTYPGAELVGMISQLSQKKYVGVPTRQAMHEIAACQFPLLRQSMIGRVVFGVLGNNIKAVMSIASKGYAISSDEIGPVFAVEVSDEHVVMEFQKQALPIEGWHSGVFAGMARALNREPTQMRVELLDEFNGQLELCWR